MKTKTKLLIGLLSFFLILNGCGGGSDDESSATTEENEVVTEIVTGTNQLLQTMDLLFSGQIGSYEALLSAVPSIPTTIKSLKEAALSAACTPDGTAYNCALTGDSGSSSIIFSDISESDTLDTAKVTATFVNFVASIAGVNISANGTMVIDAAIAYESGEVSGVNLTYTPTGGDFTVSRGSETYTFGTSSVLTTFFTSISGHDFTLVSTFDGTFNGNPLVFSKTLACTSTSCEIES